MQFFNQFSETWAHPALRHAALVHWPIAVSMLGLALSLALPFLGRRALWLRWMTAAVFLTVTIGAWLAKSSGENAEGALKRNLSAAARELIQEHEDLGGKVWMFAAGTAVLCALSTVGARGLRITFSIATVLAALFNGAWIATTAHHGGEAVYEFGAGTPGYSTDSAAAPLDPAAGSEAAPAFSDSRAAFFVSTVQPIIEQHCLRCHSGPRAKARLDQSTIAGLLKGGRGGPAIVPGRPEESLLIQMVKGTETDPAPMPPSGPLPAEQVAAMEQWIRDGAVWVD